MIDRLLERDERADYWAMKWSDLLRIKAEFPINLWPNAAQAYYHWIRTSIRENKPYDRFARELLTSSGSNFRVPPVNFYRAIQSRQPAAIAQAVALALMGARAEKWPPERLAGMSVFFAKIGYKSTAEWKEEIVFFDPNLTPGKAADKDRQRRRRSARRGADLSRRHARPHSAGSRSPRGLCRLADRRQESLVRPQYRQSRLVLARRPRHHSRARRHPPGQPAEQPRVAGLPGTGTGRFALRPEAHLSLDPELEDLSAFVLGPRQPGPRPRRTSPSIRSAAWRPRC